MEKPFPNRVLIWREIPTVDCGTWSVTRYNAEAVPYVPESFVEIARISAIEKIALMIDHAEAQGRAAMDNSSEENEAMQQILDFLKIQAAAIRKMK